MDDSMAQEEVSAAPFEPSIWKCAVSTTAAVVLATIFLVAGVWKITDPFSAAVRLTQVRLPADLSLPAAILLGISETYAGVLILVPRFRRWGAALTSLLLVAFLIYITVNYNALRGEDCGCFPWVRRAVGPAFFLSDVIMLLLAVLSGLWGRAWGSRRGAALVLGAVTVFALACFGVLAARQVPMTAPESINVQGRPFPLRQGRVFLYFYDPECSSCDAAARLMANYHWKDTTVISVATGEPQFAREFIQTTGLRGLMSTDAELLRKTFSFVDPPYAVALENGRQKAAFLHFDRQQPEAELRKLGFVH
jgi:uncharacterized membrane protein YphA (DoxX/SURF4 family)